MQARCKNVKQKNGAYPSMHMQTGRQVSFAKYIFEQVKVWKRTILINGHIKLYTCTEADHVECCSCCIAWHQRMDIDNEMTLSLATVNCNEAESG